MNEDILLKKVQNNSRLIQDLKFSPRIQIKFFGHDKNKELGDTGFYSQDKILEIKNAALQVMERFNKQHREELKNLL